MGHDSSRPRNAIRGRRRRRRARDASDWRAHYDVHRESGPAIDDPEYVQDRRRANQHGVSHRSPHYRLTRVVDLRRSQRCDDCALDGMGNAVCQLNSGSHGLRVDRASEHAAHESSLPSRVRWLPHVTRGDEDREALRRRYSNDDRQQARSRASPTRAHARPAGYSRNGAESRRVFPVTRASESLL